MACGLPHDRSEQASRDAPASQSRYDDSGRFVFALSLVESSSGVDPMKA
jgi:hypothetical protein